MDVLHDEVYDSYKENIIMELPSTEVSDMQDNLVKIIERIKLAIAKKQTR